MNNIESKEPSLIKLSASSMKTYKQCPQKYFLNYIEKAPRKYWEHLTLGNFCHTALELFHSHYMNHGTDKLTLSQNMGASFAEARKKYTDLKDETILAAKDMLSDYLVSVKENGMPNVKSVEQGFSFSINDSVLIRGFIDRVDIMKDGRFQIADYKTSKNPSYLDQDQLLIYGMWLKREYPLVTSFRGSYVLLKHKSSLKSFDFTLDDVQDMEDKILSCAENIKEEDLWTPVPSPLCNWCDFKAICPAHSAW